MKILVCIKQVCDNADTLSLDGSGRKVLKGKHTVLRMNRYDEYALEEALLIKERFLGTRVDVLSIGPESVAATIRRALGLGADHGIHISREDDNYASPLERASLISRFAGKKGYDLILTGVMAEDDMEGQVGGLTAEMLKFSCATNVVSQEVSLEEGEAKVEREIEGGRRQRLTLKLPAVLAIQSGINTPRYPVLSHMLRAGTAELERVSADDAPPAGTLRGITLTEKTGTGEIIGGAPAEKARRLLEVLHEHSLI